MSIKALGGQPLCQGHVASKGQNRTPKPLSLNSPQWQPSLKQNIGLWDPKRDRDSRRDKNKEGDKGRVGCSSRPNAREEGQTDTERENLRKDGGEVMSCLRDKQKDSEGCSGSGLGGQPHLTCAHCPSFLVSLGCV